MKKSRWFLGELFLITQWLRLRRRKLIFLAGTGCHGNIGDLAIVEAELELLKFLFPGKKIIEINSNLLKRHTKMFARIIGGNIIFIQGGGFIGTLWREEDLMAKRVIQEFPNNLIVIFPQTVYFENSDFGTQVYEETCRIFQKHKRLLLCLREKTSYELAKNILDEKRIMLLPDVVTCLRLNYKQSKARDTILFCLRKDKEKRIKKEQKEKLIKCVTDFFGKEFKISNTDMILLHRFNIKKRKVYVQRKLEEFSGAKLVVTDRLHGMVFATLTNTPCIVTDNCNYKVSGVYEWIKQYRNILYVKDIDNIKGVDIERIINCVEEYSSELYLNQFRRLSKYIECGEIENVGEY